MKAISNVQTPAPYNGPLSDCLARVKPADARDFERRWHRGQMRGWAGHWRRAGEDAAILGKPVREVAQTALELAVIYRKAASAVAVR